MAIAKLMTSTEIVETGFRSLKEVAKYLDTVRDKVRADESMLRTLETRFLRQAQTAAGFSFRVNPDEAPGKKSPLINTQKLEKIVVPKIEELRKNFAIADELSEQVDHLSTLESQVSIQFKGIRGVNDILSAVRTLKDTLKVKLDKSLEFLEGLGKKYAPESFKKMVAEVGVNISEQLKFDSYRAYGYVSEDDDKSLRFTTYVQLNHLEEDDGDTYPELYIVFTGIYSIDPDDKTAMRGRNYINVLTSFQTPGKFPPGRQFKTADEATANLGVLLSLENISNSLGTVPHNINPSKLARDKFSVGKQIADIKVDPDSITFQFLKSVNEKEFKDAATVLFKEMKKMLGKPGTNLRLKYKATRDTADKRYSLKFMFNPETQGREGQVEVHHLDWLKESMGVDENKLRKIVDIING